MFARFVALAAVVLSVGLASVASADDPTPAPSPTPIDLPTLSPNPQVNPYVKMGIDIITGLMSRQTTPSRNSANGQITYFKRFEMQLRTGSGAYRDVHLHQGTVIDPRGASLQPGQRVDVAGIAQADGSLDARAITIQQ